MIGYLNGRAIAADIIDVAGVGYQVHTPRPLPVGEAVTMWVHTAVRENDISLYAMDSPAERDLFMALTKVTGVGPKMALAALAYGAPLVAAALAAKDADALSKVPGIGKRTAQTILTTITVTDDLLTALGATGTKPEPVDDLTGVLIGMGYAPGPAHQALAAARAANPDADPSLWLRAALRDLATTRAGAA